MNKTALITGATSGIGQACAKLLAKNKFDLIITGRREDRLSFLKSELEHFHSISVQTLCFDVRDRDQTIKSLASISGDKIDVLLNTRRLVLLGTTLPLAVILFFAFSRHPSQHLAIRA